MQWTARYRDGTSLSQFEGEKEHLFGSIDQHKLRRFELNGGDRKFSVEINPNRKLVFFRRNFIKTDGIQDIHYFIGWQELYYGHNITRLIEINPNGDVEIHDNR